MECIFRMRDCMKQRVIRLVAGLLAVTVGNVTQAQYRYYCPHDCPPPILAPSAPAPSSSTPAQPDASRIADEMMQRPQVDPNVNVDTSSDVAAASSLDAAGVGMIGDHPQGFGRVYFTSGLNFGFGHTTQVAPSSGDRLFKIAENTNPNPTNRVFLLYNHFDNVVTATNMNGAPEQLNLDRITLGIERAFELFGARNSVEVRLPIIVNGLSNTQGDVPDLTGGGIGNLGLAFKRVLYENEVSLISGGLTLMLPTAEDGELRTAMNSVALTFKNEAVHLAPFLGFRRIVTDRLFLSGMGQLDFDLNGNTALISPSERKEIKDTELLLLSGQLGYWLYTADPYSYVSRIAGLAELHYTDTLQQAGSTSFSTGTLNAVEDKSVLNLSSGLHFQFAQSSTLRLAVVTPLHDENRFFDSEFLVQFNRFF